MLFACLLPLFGCSGGKDSQKPLADAEIASGQAYAQEENWPAALAAFQAAVKYAPDYSKAYLELGKASEASGAPEAALAAYANILRIEEADPKPEVSKMARFAAHSRIAALEMKLKHWDQAIEHAAKAKALAPGSAMHIPQATALLEAGRGAEAAAALDAGELTFAQVPDREYFVALAALRSKLGDNEASFRTLQGGVDRYPDSGDIRFGLGVLYLERGDSAKAREQLPYLREEASAGYRSVLEAYIKEYEAKKKRGRAQSR